MKLVLLFVGAAEAIAAKHQGTRVFDPTEVNPMVGDTVAVTFLPAEEEVQFVCTGRHWDLTVKGSSALHVSLDAIAE